MLRKNAPLYYFNIRGVYPRLKCFVVSFPLDKMLFNTAFITCAHYFIYLKFGLGRNNDLDKLVIVKLSFNRTSLQVLDLVNRLRHALDSLDNLKYFC